MLGVDDSFRLKELVKYRLSFDEPEACYDELAEIARSSLSTAFSGMSIVGKDNVLLKARLGIEASCLEREGAFCSHAIESEQDIYAVSDTLQHGFYKSHALVVNFGIRFYAAAIIRSPAGYPLGTIWVMDVKPRELSQREKTILLSLASQAIRMLEYNYTINFTGLPNRKTFLRALQEIIGANKDPSQALLLDAKYAAPQGVVGVLVIDNLDIISSIFAEEGVNNVLEGMTERMRESFPEGTVLAHIEGNTFAFAQLTDQGGERLSYESIIAKLSAPMVLDANYTQIQVSVGFISFPDNGNSASSLLFQALTAARRAKSGYKVSFPGQSKFISDSSYIKELHRVLKLGLSQSELMSYYQPQVNSQSLQLIGLESLARWHSNTLGIIPAATFIPLAQESGLITQLDYLMLENVCRDIQQWKRQQISFLPVSVNLSRESIACSDATTRIFKLLADYGVEHCYVKIEITESTMIADYDPVLGNIIKLRNMGLSVSIDDFGTGFSNLSTLRLLSFDQLKVDRQFIHNISRSNSISSLFEFIKNVSSLFSARLVCEGMEDSEDIEYLNSIGCYYHQGWYYSKALNFEHISSLMRKLHCAKQNKCYPKDHREMSALLQQFQHPEF